MAKKKTAAPAQSSSQPANESGLDGPVSVDGELYFGQKDLLRYELAQLRVVSALQSICIKKAENEATKRQLEDRLRSGQLELSELTSVAKLAESELRELQHRISDKYKVDLATITYDDVSGRISAA